MMILAIKKNISKLGAVLLLASFNLNTSMASIEVVNFGKQWLEVGTKQGVNAYIKLLEIRKSHHNDNDTGKARYLQGISVKSFYNPI